MNSLHTSVLMLTCLSACLPRGFNQRSTSETREDKFADIGFNEWFESLAYGPIPNYELTANIVFHKIGSDLLPDFPIRSVAAAQLTDRLIQTSNGSLKGSSDGGTGMAWIRDYHPIAIRSRDPKAGGKVRFVSYLSVHQGRNVFTGTDMQSRQPDLLNPAMIAIDHSVIGAEKESISTIKMPIILEGGNLVSTGEYVFHTEHLFRQNSPEYFKFASGPGKSANRESFEQIYKENGFYQNNAWGDKFEYRSPERVTDILAKYLEVDKNNIISVPPMPGEGTQHVDLFILPLGRRHVMIPAITDEGIATLAFADEKVLASQARDFLNSISERLRNRLGIQVDRLPMLPPVYQTNVSDQRQGVFFSPANSLLINAGADKKIVFLPHFDVPRDWGDAFRSYADQIETEWQKYFNTLGWRSEFVTSNKAARAFGLIHCLTAQVPFVSEKHLKRFQKLGY